MSVIKTVYLVRHGQSVDNASPVYQSVNSPLSQQGVQQAKAVAKRLQHVPFETLISSPILRARQTAEQIAAKTGKNIEFSDLFIERVKPSIIEGKPYTDPIAAKIWREWEASLSKPGVKVGDAESYDDLIVRADQALAYLLQRPEATMAVVTHGWFLRVMVARILIGNNLSGPIIKRFHERAVIENSGITVLKYADAFEREPSWHLWTLNDHSHFAE